MRHLLALALLGAVAIPAEAAGPASPAASTPIAVSREAAPLPQSPGQIELVAPVTSVSLGPVAIGVDADVYCSGYLGNPDEEFPAAVVGAEAQSLQAMFFQGDLVYIDIGTQRGAVAGQEFWLVRSGAVVYENETDLSPVGRIWETPGRVRIICALEEESIAEIVASCDPALIGDQLTPFEPIPIPLVRRSRVATSCDPPTGKLTGRIVATFDRVTPVGQESIVYLNRGELDGLTPGDFLTVYRYHAQNTEVRTILGEAAVLMTRDRTAVAKIVSMHDLMGVGDEIELK